MAARLIVVRPEPGCSSTLSDARERGIAAAGYPLFEIRPLPWQGPEPEAIDAMLFGSANALRHGGESLRVYRGKPAFCVGQATAQAAREAGFEVRMAGSGGLQKVLEAIEAPMRLLRVAGARHVPLVHPSGVQVATSIAYESVGLPMPEELAGELRAGAVMLLHSAEAARHAAAECDRLVVPRQGVAIAALGPRIAAAAGEGWARLAVAERPNDDELLDLAGRLCHDLGENS